MAEARPLLLLLHLMMALGPALQQILLSVEPDTSSPTASSRLSHESQQGRVTGGRNTSGRWARSLQLGNQLLEGRHIRVLALVLLLRWL